jgi:hypothetical protein
MTPVEFLIARLDEAEALATAATPGPWEAEEGGESSAIITNVTMVVRRGWEGDGGIDLAEDAQHIAANNPAYVLADIAAKRRLVRDFEVNERMIAIWAANSDACEAIPPHMLDRRNTLEQVVLALCAPFAAHLDFDLSWAI